MSDVPWSGPVGVVRVAQCKGELVVNPTSAQLKHAQFSLLYGGTDTQCVMVQAWHPVACLLSKRIAAQL